MSPARRIVYHLGLIGYPLGHSLSPQLHHAALAAAGLEGNYRLFPVPPGESEQPAMAALAERLRREDLHGLNVTIPHKQAMMRLVDGLSEVARAVSAVNTLCRAPDGRLVGDNTDVPGFLRDLDRLLGGGGPGKALVLGAGGSARAVVYGLGRSGWQVKVVARRMEQAATLVNELSLTLPKKDTMAAGVLTGETLAVCGNCDLLVNTTPLGMHPRVESCPWPEEIPLPGQAAVYDLVYNPLETVLVRRARAAGQKAAGGAGMLVAQAAMAFQRWTGLEAPYDVMERAFYEPQPPRIRTAQAADGSGQSR
jgi:shikimate dehydrogenase